MVNTKLFRVTSDLLLKIRIFDKKKYLLFQIYKNNLHISSLIVYVGG